MLADSRLAGKDVSFRDLQVEHAFPLPHENPRLWPVSGAFRHFRRMESSPVIIRRLASAFRSTSAEPPRSPGALSSRIRAQSSGWGKTLSGSLRRFYGAMWPSSGGFSQICELSGTLATLPLGAYHLQGNPGLGWACWIEQRGTFLVAILPNC